MHKLYALLLLITLSFSFKAAYEPRRYSQFIAQSLEELNVSKQLNEKKIDALNQSRAYMLKKEKQQQSPSFKAQLTPALEGNEATRQRLLEENRLIQGAIDRLTQAHANTQLSSIKDQQGEDRALRRVEQQARIDTLQRESARAQRAQAFFERQKSSQDPQFSKSFESLKKEWAKKQKSLSTQLAKEEAALPSLS